MSFVRLLLLGHLFAVEVVALTLRPSLSLATNLSSEIPSFHRLATLTNPEIDCLVDRHATVIEESSCRSALAKISHDTRPHVYAERSALTIDTIALPIRFLSGEWCCSVVNIFFDLLTAGFHDNAHFQPSAICRLIETHRRWIMRY